ncbi:MAG TPA: thrombospondin type 3 repeat-containing protein [Polyangiaceae bacterium]
MNRAKVGLGWIACCVVATCGVEARAQVVVPPAAARTWRPPTDPAGDLATEPVVTPGSWRWNLGLWGSYAQDPVVLRDASTGAATSRPLEHAIGLDVVANIGLGSRAAVGVDLPMSLWQDGSAFAPRDPFHTTALGDLAIIGKATIASNDRQGLRAGFGLGMTATVTVPTGDRPSFLGDGGVTSSFSFLGEYALGVGAVRASLGYTLRTNGPVSSPLTGSVEFDDAVPWSAGIVVRPRALALVIDAEDRQEWEVAMRGALPAGPVAPFSSGATALSPVLLSVGDRIALGSRRDAFVVWGADVGLDDAYGVPAFRTMFGLGWAPRVHDRDNDGVPDDVDQCPDLPEDRDGIQDDDGCPEDDADSDGIPDDVDGCPLVAGEASQDPKKNGCPRAPDAPRGTP